MDGWAASLWQKNGKEGLSLQFDSFNDLMLFVGVARRCAHYPDFAVSPPAGCTDKDLFTDISALLYLYAPEDLCEAPGVYARCAGRPEAYAAWVRARFNLNVSVCRNIRVVNEVEEVEEVVTHNNDIVASEIYLRPKYIEVRSIPAAVTRAVEQFQRLLSAEVYGRLVQVCQFSYPSPVPLVRAILDLYSAEWVTLFDENPYAFLKAIRESKMYRKESYTNRSYKRPCANNGVLCKLDSIQE